MAEQFQGAPLAEMFALLGVDSSELDRGLQAAKVKMKQSADEMVISIKSVKDILKTLPQEAIMPIVERYAAMGKTVEQANQDIVASVLLVDEAHRKAFVQRQADLKMGREMALEQTRIDRDAARMEAGFERDRIANIQLEEAARSRATRMRIADIETVRRLEADMAQRTAQMNLLNAQFASAMNRRDEAEGGAGVGVGAGLVGSIMRRAAVYAAVYESARFARAALERPVEIQRQAEQTGLSVESVQRLQYAATATQTPIETVAAAVARLQSNVEKAAETMSGPAHAALNRLGIDSHQLKTEMEDNLDGAIIRVVRTINDLGSSAQRNEAFLALFGSRTGKVAEALKMYSEDLGRQTLLSAENIKEMSDLVGGLAVKWMRAKDQFDLYMIATIHGAQRYSRMGGSGSPSWSDLGLTPWRTPSGPSYPPTDINLGRSDPLGRFPPPVPLTDFAKRGLPEGVGQAVEAKDIREQFTAWQAERRRLEAEIRKATLESIQTPERREIQRLMDNYQEVMGRGEPYGISSDVRGAFKRSTGQAIENELQKEQNKQLEETKRLLDDFGASGKRNAQLVESEFRKLREAFREGRVGIEELREATANYYAMMEEERARPALREAIKMFEQGMLGDEDLVRAYRREQALKTRGGVEEAFMRGEANPSDLREAQRRYRMQLENERRLPEPRPDTGMPLYQGGPMFRLRDIPIPPAYFMPQTPQSQPPPQGGVINIIPMDEFSNQMMRRWQQQGLLTS